MISFPHYATPSYMQQLTDADDREDAGVRHIPTKVKLESISLGTSTITLTLAPPYEIAVSDRNFAPGSGSQ
jgi:hypothetical protein